MATKNNPGQFDCYANAEPDEPMFVLLGRDKHAAILVAMWAMLRKADGEDESKVTEAQMCAMDMQAYCESLGKQPVDFAALVKVQADLYTKMLEHVFAGVEDLLKKIEG